MPKVTQCVGGEQWPKSRSSFYLLPHMARAIPFKRPCGPMANCETAVPRLLQSPFSLFPWDAGSTQRAVGEGSEQSLPWKWSEDQMALSSLSLVKWNQNQLLNFEGRAAGCRGPLSLSLHGLPTLWSVKALLLGAGGCPAQVSAEWNQMRGEIQSKMLDPGEATLGQSADRLLPAWLWETYFLSHFTFHQKWGRRYAEGKRIML